MSINSEINRISSAKDALTLAISGKGVDVPSGTKVDGYAALVNQIDNIMTVTSVPLIKETSIIFNSTNGKYYLWRA